MGCGVVVDELGDGDRAGGTEADVVGAVAVAVAVVVAVIDDDLTVRVPSTDLLPSTTAPALAEPPSHPTPSAVPTTVPPIAPPPPLALDTTATVPEPTAPPPAVPSAESFTPPAVSAAATLTTPPDADDAPAELA